MRSFRAWHTKLNRYLKDYEFYVGSDGSVYSAFELYDDKILEIEYIEDFSRDDFDEGYIIREDDTGLKDKNGKKIYEGDIVKYAWTNCNYRVVIRRYDVSFCLENDYREEIFLLQYNQQKDYEVISNIHENPELLREEK